MSYTTFASIFLKDIESTLLEDMLLKWGCEDAVGEIMNGLESKGAYLTSRGDVMAPAKRKVDVGSR
jgi:hypothetical protein